MTETERTTIWISLDIHQKLKLRSVKNRTSIPEEAEKILEPALKED